MDDKYFLLYVSLSLLFILYTLKLLHRPNRNSPPSPYSLPIIGHLHHLKPPIHRSFHKLSTKHGPVLSLRLGSRRIVLLSSSSAVQDCFTANDIALANRPCLLIGKHLGYNCTTMATSPYGDHWRNLRRIGAIEVFSTHRLNSFAAIRNEEVRRMLRSLARGSVGGFSRVQIPVAMAELTMDIVMRMVAGKRCVGGREIRGLTKEAVALGGVSNLGDFVPVLNWVSNGYERKLIKIGRRMDLFLQGLVEEHRGKRGEGRNTMIDHLLSLQESDPDVYGDQIIKGFLMVLLLAGTDTSSVTIEWALSYLLNNPQVMKKAREELDVQIGQERLVEESDISKLPYLHAIISETLRLSPAAPLLLPRLTAEDCTVCGYHIPRDTIVLMNAWAMHRDPNQWEDPTSFKPERFEKSESEVHKLVAFGVGRRACPGAAMAQRTVGLTLAALIQCFEWERVGEEEVDMAEGKGLTMPKASPLEAMCRARPVVHKLFGLDETTSP